VGQKKFEGSIFLLTVGRHSEQLTDSDFCY